MIDYIDSLIDGKANIIFSVKYYMEKGVCLWLNLNAGKALDIACCLNKWILAVILA